MNPSDDNLKAKSMSFHKSRTGTFNGDKKSPEKHLPTSNVDTLKPPE